MSVFNTKYDDDNMYGRASEHEGKCCSCCGDKLQYPFLHWDGLADPATGFCMCGECCLLYRDKIVADMIHCAAAYEMRNLRNMPGWPTLVRVSEHALEEEGKRKERTIHAVKT